MSTLHPEQIKAGQARGAGITYDAVREILADHASITDSFGRTVERLRDLAFHAAETLAKDRVAALLDAERENTALRAEVERLRGEVSYLRACVPLPLGLDRVFATIVDNIADGEHRREEEK